jgi:hypothetical protein
MMLLLVNNEIASNSRSGDDRKREGREMARCFHGHGSRRFSPLQAGSRACRFALILKRRVWKRGARNFLIFGGEG